MDSKWKNFWEEVTIVSLAPLSIEKVSPFKGKRPYLATGGLDVNRVIHIESVTHANRPSRANIVVRQGDVIAARMKNTVKVLEIGPELNGLIVSTGFAVFRPSPKILSGYLSYFLRSRIFQAIKDKYAQGSTQKAINNTDLKRITIPLPLIPVQERIFQILHKADEINQKRRQALEMADAILPAYFLEIFGDPGLNPKGLPRKKLGDICTPISGGTPSKNIKEYWTNGNIPWVSPEDMKIPELHTVSDKITDAGLGNRKVTQNGTVLIVVRGMILAHTVPIAIVRAPMIFNQDIKGLLPNDGIPGEFLYWALKCSHGRLKELVDTASHGTRKIETYRLMNIDLYVGAENTMRAFAETHRRFFEDQNRRSEAANSASALFLSLLDQAFSGRLTSEWESINESWVQTQVDLQERLPRYILLSFIGEKSTRVHKTAQMAVLVTDLMKYVFLLQMEGPSGWRYYQFEPYHYGPFAKEVYADLKRLQADGLISIANDTEEDKTRINLTDSEKVETTLADLPGNLREDVTIILEQYGELDYKTLLKTIYKKYPVYASKSKIKKGIKRKK